MSSADRNDNVDEKKIFFTTTDLISKINSSLAQLEGPDDTLINDDAAAARPRFELHKRTPFGTTVKADERETAVADMESKFKQAASEVQDLTPCQKLQWADIQRKEGNALVAKKRYKEAVDVYLTCLVVKSDDPAFYEEVFLPVMSNLAFCTLNMKCYRKTEVFCTMALEEKHLPSINNHISTIAKLYFRRGKARRLGGFYTLASEDMETAQSLLTANNNNNNNNNKRDLSSIHNEFQLLKRSQQHEIKHAKTQQSAMRGLFDSPSVHNHHDLQRHGEDKRRAFNNERDVNSSSDLQSGGSLYKSRPTRKFSTLRAEVSRPSSNDEEEEVMKEEATISTNKYWQYYMAVVGAVAERLLHFLGETDSDDHQLHHKKSS